MTLEQVGETENWTPIQIEGPLPMNVAGVLMQLIGRTWPEAVIRGGTRYVLDMAVPAGQEAKTVDDEFIEQMRKESEPAEFEGTFLGFREGELVFAPPEELQLALGNFAHVLMSTYENAINHLEWEVLAGKDEDAPRYVLSISRSKEQTPLAMRKAAEAKLEEAEKENKRLRRLLKKNGIEA